MERGQDKPWPACVGPQAHVLCPVVWTVGRCRYLVLVLVSFIWCFLVLLHRVVGFGPIVSGYLDLAALCAAIPLYNMFLYLRT